LFCTAACTQHSATQADDDGVRVRKTAQLAMHTKAALSACPSLLSRGQWTRCWDKTTSVFKVPRGAPEVTDKRFWMQMQTEITAHMDTTYKWVWSLVFDSLIQNHCFFRLQLIHTTSERFVPV
jgi:hypothetical protein